MAPVAGPDPVSGWAVRRPGPMASGPLAPVHRPAPEPGPDDLLLTVEACGVCRTDLHLAEGDLPPHRPATVPGHEIVGRVVAAGEAVTAFRTGDRAGGAWLRSTCGSCRYCRAGRENLCPASLYTGWDADGGFAEAALVPADFAYPLPDDQDATLLAPLLCAGIIGYRALRRSALPSGGRLGIYGFGASAHLAAQVALAEGATVHVLTRSARARELALDLGASSAGGAYDRPPEPLDSAILFAPVGDLVPVALEALDRVGHARRCRYPPHRHPPAPLPAPSLPRADLRSVTVQHPPGRPRVPGHRGTDRHPGHRQPLSVEPRPAGARGPGRRPGRGAAVLTPG